MVNYNEPQPKWFAVYTKGRWEKKVAGQLERKNIEHYCPLNRVVRQWSDRKKVVWEPLFKSYVFVRIHEQKMLEVIRTDGVLHFVHWLDKPAVIRDEEIEAIRRFLGEHDNVQLEKTEVKVNDNVRIIYGPLLDQQGRIREVNSKTVKVELPSLGYALVAQVPKEHIRVIEKVGAFEGSTREQIAIS
jgi:Transcription antiterminator